MIENPAYTGVEHYFSTRMPKDRTDRISDLNRLLAVEGSFCIFSEHRNGITTLMREVARRKNGIYVDSQSLQADTAVEELETKISSGNNLILLDEAIAFFDRLGSYEKAIDYLQQLSERRPVGLRIHPSGYRYREDLCSRGFEVVEIGKISYEELKAICDTQFGSIGFSFPERLIQYAHTRYNRLGESVWYIGEAFRLMTEEKRLEVSEAEVRESVEERYVWFRKKRD